MAGRVALEEEKVMLFPSPSCHNGQCNGCGATLYGRHNRPGIERCQPAKDGALGVPATFMREIDPDQLPCRQCDDGVSARVIMPDRTTVRRFGQSEIHRT